MKFSIVIFIIFQNENGVGICSAGQSCALNFLLLRKFSVFKYINSSTVMCAVLSPVSSNKVSLGNCLVMLRHLHLFGPLKVLMGDQKISHSEKVW